MKSHVAMWKTNIAIQFYMAGVIELYMYRKRTTSIKNS